MAPGVTARAALFGGGLLIAVAGALPAGEVPHARIREGNRAYESEDYVEAEVGYRKALEAEPDLPEGRFNLGDALYRQGRYEPAAGAFEEAGAAADGALRANAHFNRGNAFFREEKYRESIDAYVEALRADPDDEDAKYNLSLARRMLKAQQQKQRGRDGTPEEEPPEEGDREEKPGEEPAGEKGTGEEEPGRRRSDGEERSRPERGEEPVAGEERREPEPEPPPPPGEESGGRESRGDRTISRAEAERILQAVRDDEKEVQRKLRARASGPVDVEKDW